MAAEGFNASEVSSFRTMFDSCDADKSGKLDHEEVQVLMRKSGEEVGFARVGEIIAQIDKNNDGQVDFKEFLGCMRVIKSGASSIGGASSPMTKVFKSGALYQTKGEGGAMHSISEDERDAFAGHINLILGSDVFLQDRLPMDPTDPNALFEVCKDGILLAKLVNKVEPGTVDERALNLKAKLSKFQQIENCNLAINAAKAIGCKLVNIGATNLLDGTEHLILGVCWQIIRKTLLSNISIKNHPELFRLLEDDESLEKLGRLPPEQILMRWVNFQLKRAESSRIITNFGSDLKDCEVYSQLLHQLDPARCSLVTTGTNEVKAPKILENVTAMGLQPFLKANDIVSGNSKLNLGMVAQIFNANPGLAEVTIEEQEELEANFAALVVDDNSGDTREERTFRMWINSLNLDGVREEDGTVFINDLYFGLADGFTILRLMDRIQPGIVNWKRVHKNPKGRIHAVDNCNTVVTLAKQMDLVVVNIGGSDLCDGNKKLVLAVMWQLMRRFTLDMLKELSTDGAVTEKTLVDWANAKVQEAKPEAGSPPKPARIRNLNDKGLADATFLLLLCSAVAPRTVDWSLGALGDGDQKSNAQYAISVARKIGACVFLSPEDITEVKPKMLFSFIAAIKLVALQGGQPALASADASSAAAEEPSSGPSPPKPPPPPPAAPAAAAAEPATPTGASVASEALAPAAVDVKPSSAPATTFTQNDVDRRMTLAKGPSTFKPPPVPSASKLGFASINGSGERGGLYGGTSGATVEEDPEVDEDEW